MWFREFVVPVREIIRVGIGVIDETAFLGHQTVCDRATAAKIPAQRTLSGCRPVNFDRFFEMLAFGFLVDKLVVDPTITMAGNFPFRRPHRVDNFGIAPERHRNTEYCDRHFSFHEHVVESPESGTGAVLIYRLHVHMALILVRLSTDNFGQECFRCSITVQ